MKVFVTGGTGYVGAHVVRALVARGHGVTILARDPHRIPSFVGANGIVSVPGDVRDRRTFEGAIAGHDALVHNALVWGDEAREHALEDTRATMDLLAAARDADVRHVIYTSSTAVHRPFTPRMRESDPVHPTDSYAMTKAMSELAVWAWAQQSDRAATIVRAGPVVGPPAASDAPFKCDPRFERMVDDARAGRSLRVARHDGRQFVVARDLAQVFVRALEAEAGRRTLLAVARDFVTWEEIARAIVARVGSGEVIVEGTGLGPTPFVFDTDALEDTLGLAFTARDALMAHVALLTR